MEQITNAMMDTDSCLFSIIIPCFNVEKYVRECLDSLINQTIEKEELQIILVDDCSTDNTVDILKEYEANYPDLLLLILLDKNGRQGRARNIGLEYATGKYISFVDSDDVVRLDMYEILKHIVEKDNLDVVQFRYQIFRNGTVPEYRIDDVDVENSNIFEIYDYGNNRKQYLLNSNIMNESCTQKVYRRSIVEKVGLKFMEGCAYEEPLFTYPVKFMVDRVAVLEQALYFYRENREGTTLGYMSTPSTIFDHINTQLVLRDNIIKMKDAAGFEDETDLYFLHSFYAEPFYFMKSRGWVMPVELWRYLKEKVLLYIPNYMSNVYLDDASLKEEKMLLELIQIDEDDEMMQKILNSALEII